MNQRSVTQTDAGEGWPSTMSNSLSEDYLRWLAPQIREDNGLSNPNQEFWGLLTIMYEKEFTWTVPNDHNRLGDGLDLRVAFCYANDIPMRERRREPLRSFLHREPEVPFPPVSFLEVLIGLSERLAFNAGGTAPGRAWELLCNLNLHHMADPLSRRSANKANNILDRCVRRAYLPDGRGGFFPLEQPHEDQRQVEIWYQMSAYIGELDRNRSF